MSWSLLSGPPNPTDRRAFQRRTLPGHLASRPQRWSSDCSPQRCRRTLPSCLCLSEKPSFRSLLEKRSYPKSRGLTSCEPVARRTRRERLARMAYYFVIVGTRDNPLYEAQLTSSKFPAPAPLPPNVASAVSLFATGGVPGYGHKNSRHVMQMVAHASLDAIEDVQWTVPTM